MLTNEEILELEQLLRVNGLTTFDDQTNPNYVFLHDAIQNQKYSTKGKLLSGYTGCILEGSSRSGKTWSGIDIIIWICTELETDCKINIYRETFAEFKDTLYDDFKRRLDDFGLPNPFHNAEIVRSFKIGKNKISFKGCDKLGKSHGAGCDYIFFNEVMHIPYPVFDQAEMRCRKFWWADYNPSFSDHWLFDRVEPRPDVGFLHTTFKDNPFISHTERNKILGYEPWKPGSYEVKTEGLYYQGKLIDDENQPPPHPTNIENGTADEYMWRVYGLGMRGSMKGVIIEHLKWIDKFPDVAHIYCNDFGFTTDPNALIKYAEDDKNIWFELLHYNPVETDSKLSELLEGTGVKRNENEYSKDGDLIICDSSDRYAGDNGVVEMVKGLKRKRWNAQKVHKTKSIMYWLGSMKEKKIHCVKNKLWKHVKRERENYKFKEVQGIMINQPIDKFNHIFDGVRYGHMAHNSQPIIHGKKQQSLKDMGIDF